MEKLGEKVKEIENFLEDDRNYKIVVGVVIIVILVVLFVLVDKMYFKHPQRLIVGTWEAKIPTVGNVIFIFNSNKTGKIIDTRDGGEESFKYGLYKGDNNKMILKINKSIFEVKLLTKERMILVYQDGSFWGRKTTWEFYKVE